MEEMFNSAKGIRLGGNIVAMTAIAIGTSHSTQLASPSAELQMITEQLFATEKWVVTASWVVFVIGGVLCGFLVLCLTAFGIFAVGTVAGVMLAMVLNERIGLFDPPEQP